MDKHSYRVLEKKIGHYGNDAEKEIYKLGKNILGLLNRLDQGEKYREGWGSFNVLKTAFKDTVGRYKGIYSDYFSNMMAMIEEQERQALGYHLH